jgi:hypothetical protein
MKAFRHNFFFLISLILSGFFIAFNLWQKAVLPLNLYSIQGKKAFGHNFSSLTLSFLSRFSLFQFNSPRFIAKKLSSLSNSPLKLTNIIPIHIHIIRVAVMVVVLDVIIYPLKLIERVLLLSIVAINRIVLIVAVEVAWICVVVNRRLLVVLCRLNHRRLRWVRCRCLKVQFLLDEWRKFRQGKKSELMQTHIQVRSIHHLHKLSALQHEHQILICFQQTGIGALGLFDRLSNPSHLY